VECSKQPKKGSYVADSFLLKAVKHKGKVCQLLFKGPHGRLPYSFVL
jgi:hypothetical protein